jgi:hypothetical protein
MAPCKTIGFASAWFLLSLIVLFVSPFLTSASPATASGHFEVYCDGLGIFLAKIDGAPDSGKLVLFSQLGYALGIEGHYVGQGKWTDIRVFRNGCIPDDKCKSIGDGRVWVEALDAPPKHISGKYEITLNGKRLSGAFVAKRHDRKRPIRLCM